MFAITYLHSLFFIDLDQSDADLRFFSIINILLATDLKARENKNQFENACFCNS